jgi:hypothetical protein
MFSRISFEQPGASFSVNFFRDTIGEHQINIAKLKG